MPARVKARPPWSRPAHPDCDAQPHGGPDCICPTQRQREHDAKGGTAIPAHDPAIELEFKAMPGPNYEATLDDEWMAGPLPCKTNPDVFFGPGEKGPVGADLREARSLCSECAFVRPCLERVLEQRDAFAYAGNTTPGERRAILAQRRGVGTSTRGRRPFSDDTRGAIVRLADEGQIAADVARSLNVSLRTVQRVLAEQREQAVA